MKRGRAVKVVAQKQPASCGVAALAMLLEVSYGDASAAVRQVAGRLDVGTGVKDLVAAAGVLGHRLKPVRRRRDYLDGATGILGVLPNDERSSVRAHGHWVILKQGVIIDPDQTVWPNALDYFTVERVRPVTLLVRAV